MRIFHFSDDPEITVFEPRPVLVPSERPPGLEWLNGPLVWAVTEERQATYLCPRDCPRIVLWARPDTTDADARTWLGEPPAPAVVYVEAAWEERLHTASLHRYELPSDTFEPVSGDGWMQVSRAAVVPIDVRPCGDLVDALAATGAELRIVDRLTGLREVWSTTLHASGIRLRNARDWT